jgi:tetratricopeptide (TPR) repeat protein
MKTVHRFCLGLGLLFALVIASTADGKIVEFTREYTYQASDADSKLTSRAIATEQIKRLLLEELGTFLISRSEVRDAELTKDEVVSFTAGSVATIIISERWNGSEYYLKAQIKADPDKVTEAIVAIKKNETDAEEMERLRKKSDESLKEIDRLKGELADLRKNSSPANSDKVSKVQREYDQTVAGLSAKEITQQGVSLLRDKKYPEAIELFSKAIAVDPKAIPPYGLRGSVYMRLKKYDKAIGNWNQAISALPDEGIVYCQRGRTYLMMRQDDNALNDFNTAISKSPMYFPAYLSKGDMLVRRREFGKALENYAQAVAAMKGNPAPYFQRGRIYFIMKDSDKAMENLETALELRPDYVDALVMKSHVYAQRREYAQGIAVLEKAVQQRKRDYILPYQLGRLYHDAKRYEEAVKAFSNAIELRPTISGAYFARSQSYEALKQKGKALQDLEKAAELGNRLAQTRLDQSKRGGVHKPDRTAPEDPINVDE